MLQVDFYIRNFRMALVGIMSAMLVLLSTVSSASTLNQIIVKGDDTVVTVDGTVDGLTKVTLDRFNNDTTGVWLLMDPSSSAVDEDFRITINNDSITHGNTQSIWQMSIQVIKQGTQFGSFIPTALDWEDSLFSAGGGATPEGTVTMSTENSSSSHSFVMALGPVLPAEANSSMFLDLHADSPAPGPGWFEDAPWIDFNLDRGQFLLNIDLNEVDNNLPAHVPLPPAVWMFGSALLGLVSFTRRRTE